MKTYKFKAKPREIMTVRYMGEHQDDVLPFLNVIGERLPAELREVEFYNKLHNIYFRAKHGEYIVIDDMNDLYPINEAKLLQAYEEFNELKSCVYKAHLKIKADRIEWLEARIKELEHYINMTENFPYQSKTNAELEALHSNAIEARDWFTCDLIANEKYRRTELPKEKSK